MRRSRDGVPQRLTVQLQSGTVKQAGYTNKLPTYMSALRQRASAMQETTNGPLPGIGKPLKPTVRQLLQMTPTPVPTSSYDSARRVVVRVGAQPEPVIA